MAAAGGGERHSSAVALAAKSFFTPPPSSSNSSWHSYDALKDCKTDTHYKIPSSPPRDLFHIIHKVPAGDSPYVRAKRVQLIEKDPSRAISLFWRAINSGDRVDSAVKDMAVVMKQLDRSNEAIEAIKSFRHLCSKEAQDSLDNILIELYKRSGRIDEQIDILQSKVKHIEKEAGAGGKRTKMARSQGRKVQITIEQEYSRLLGNLAWGHLQQENYRVAEEYYRKALSIELDRNKQCNLAVCLMHMDRINEAKLLLQAITSPSVHVNQEMDESCAKSYERATELLEEIESGSFRKENYKCSEDHTSQSFFSSPALRNRTISNDDDDGITKEFECQSQADNDQLVNGLKSLPPNTPKATSWNSSSPYADQEHSAINRRNEEDWEKNSPMTQPMRCLQQKRATFPSPVMVRECSNSPFTQPKRHSPSMLSCDGRDATNIKFKGCPNRRLQFQDQPSVSGVTQVPFPPPPSFNNSKGGAGLFGSGNMTWKRDTPVFGSFSKPFGIDHKYPRGDFICKTRGSAGSPLRNHNVKENYVEETKDEVPSNGSSIESQEYIQKSADPGEAEPFFCGNDEKSRGILGSGCGYGDFISKTRGWAGSPPRNHNVKETHVEEIKEKVPSSSSSIESQENIQKLAEPGEAERLICGNDEKSRGILGSGCGPKATMKGSQLRRNHKSWADMVEEDERKLTV